tara:strand:+ start:55 stop:252 length:198 start_codon:yes stop_codon:yes gene_type:complete
MSNYPDDCQGMGIHLPWNAPEQEVYVCWSCGEEGEENTLTDIKTKHNGYQLVGECCSDMAELEQI